MQIVAAGGDGTISEVMNGIVRTQTKAGGTNQVALGVIPFGSANDFAINLGLPLELGASVDTIIASRYRRIDIGFVCWGSDPHGRYFDNNSAMGLEPTITLIQQRIHRLRGVLRYLLATLIGVMQKPAWQAQIEWQDGSYEGPVSLVTVGNNPLTGGLFYMTPHARPDDGQLTFVYGYLPTRRSILSILPKTMKPGSGSYVEHPDIHEIHSPWLKISTTTATPLHADGEIQSQDVVYIGYSILPAHLTILIPAGESSG
jgi:YegS/Rv2252/BmrU family lipid kinase